MRPVDLLDAAMTDPAGAAMITEAGGTVPEGPAPEPGARRPLVTPDTRTVLAAALTVHDVPAVRAVVAVARTNPHLIAAVGADPTTVTARADRTRMPTPTLNPDSTRLAERAAVTGEPASGDVGPASQRQVTTVEHAHDRVRQVLADELPWLRRDLARLNDLTRKIVDATSTSAFEPDST